LPKTLSLPAKTARSRRRRTPVRAIRAIEDEPRVVECRDIITATLPTWEHARAVYERRDGEVTRRYGRRLADRILAQLELIPGILAARGSFPVLCAQKPPAARAAEPPVESRFR
jgi:hypothetical protein